MGIGSGGHFCVKGLQVDSMRDYEGGKFATGTGEVDGSQVNIWNIVTGKRLVGPLKHGKNVIGVKFSPNGERVATACWDSLIRIFDSHNGDQLITIKVDFKYRWLPAIPLAWSDNGQKIFVASGESKIIAVNSSTGSQLAESLVHNDDNYDSKVVSIALAANGKFLSTFAGNFISFWDTSTLVQVNLPTEDSRVIRSIALSPDCNYVSTGTEDGKIMVHNLANIIPESYGPFCAPTPKEPDSEMPQDHGPQDTSRAHNDNTPEQSTTPSMLGSEEPR
ncbi:WD40-repeat-containing domain protein [Butyriboletus roseoflavus]|nr:WD40-repeat-containing domain protein [Butyriboletus roseoflavus]